MVDHRRSAGFVILRLEPGILDVSGSRNHRSAYRTHEWIKNGRAISRWSRQGPVCRAFEEVEKGKDLAARVGPEGDDEDHRTRMESAVGDWDGGVPGIWTYGTAWNAEHRNGWRG